MEFIDAIERDGFVVLPNVFSAAAVDEFARELDAALSATNDEAEAIRSRAGQVYAARNVLTLYPRARELWREPSLHAALRQVLGPRFGLARALYFDKPPERTWSLPWHQDLTIAVEDYRLESDQFTKPTRKAGVDHVEAPTWLLESMLTARLHLDDVTDENGPLKVIPGSHRGGKAYADDVGNVQAIHAGRGDVLLIRPLVAHSSGLSREGTTRRRRILHLEFAADSSLPDGFRWREFIPRVVDAIAYRTGPVGRTACMTSAA